MHREDRDQMERSYSDLNPELAANNDRLALKEKRRKRAIEKQRDIDAEGLLTDPRFIRWLFTVSEKAGIFTPSFHAQEGSRQFLDGFRAFGLALFDDLEVLDSTLWVRISLERAKTLNQKDAPDDNDPGSDDRGLD